MPRGMGFNLVDKHKKCRMEQKGWLRCLEHARYDGIELLDSRSGSLTSLREQIMKIKAPNGINSLFVSVNQQWNNPELVVFSFRKQDSNEAQKMIPALRTYITKSTKIKEYGNYFNDIGKMHSKNFDWDEETKSIINRSDKFIPEAATAADIVFWGLEEYIDYNEDDEQLSHTSTATAETQGIDNTTSSVNTFTSGTSTKKFTGRFDDASTIASVSSTDTETSDQHKIPSNIHTIQREIVKLTNSITLLNVNAKARDEESKQLFQKFATIEGSLQAISTPLPTNSASTSVNQPDQPTHTPFTKTSPTSNLTEYHSSESTAGTSISPSDTS